MLIFLPITSVSTFAQQEENKSEAPELNQYYFAIIVGNQISMCVLCGSKENLHFDHDLPYSKGGSSLTSANVKILCAKHNLSKSSKILSIPPILLRRTSLLFIDSGFSRCGTDGVWNDPSSPATAGFAGQALLGIANFDEAGK